MKAIFAIVVLVTAIPAAAASLPSIDVTNDPNASFFDGYERIYKRFDDGSKCSAMYAFLRSGDSRINLNMLCEGLGITEKQMRDDLYKSMRYVKDHSSAKSFRQYFQISRNSFFTDEPQQFCIKKTTIGYEFLDVKAANSPGWKYIYNTSFSSSGGLSSNIIGLWKATANGSVLARMQGDTFKVDMRLAEQCGTVPYAPNLLLPSS